MITGFTKSVFISYAPEDLSTALRLRDVLTGFVGSDEVWIRNIDLKSGELVAEAINSAVTEAKWFLFMLSEASANSDWGKSEINLATLRAIEDEDFRVVVLKLDGTLPPVHVQRAIQAYETIDLTTSTDKEYEFMKLAETIRRTISTYSKSIVYVDRGEDADQFALTGRRNKIVFIVGWSGIGKTAFVKHSIPNKLRKSPRTITLTRGHSTDLLCRQILQQLRVPQPLNEVLTDDDWTLRALEALEQRSETFFLFLDNAEEAVDPASQLLPYLEGLLVQFARSNIQTHVILATTRVPEYPPAIGAVSDVIHINRLDDVYIKECIDLWLTNTPNHDRVLGSHRLEELIAHISGHPLAAKMIASFLKTRSPNALIESKLARRIQLKLAEHMLRASNHTILSKVHQALLQSLAAIGEPITMRDVLESKILDEYQSEEVQTARWELADWYLLEQNGDLMYLPKFFDAYFREQLEQEKGRFEQIASEYGTYGLGRALSINEKLKAMPADNQADREKQITLSSEVFRYAVPSGRLLRAIGRDELAARLPIEIKGTLRELVFHFYQTRRDYQKALQYADRWLTINPHDLEVMLYRVRCHRNIGGSVGFKAAERLLDQLERRDHKKSFAARIFRERALIATRRGDDESAKAYFLQGIELNAYGYPDNHIGLAQLLLQEIDEWSPFPERNLELAKQALQYLDHARELSAVFDRFHLGTYIEALIQAGHQETAVPLLELAVKDRPEDARLNYRMAELLRSKEQFKEAERYAMMALEGGALKAHVTLTNIYFGWSLACEEQNQPGLANTKLTQALQSIEKFTPEYGNDFEMADGLACKILCALRDIEGAKKRIMKYTDSDNPYTIYEQCRVDNLQADNAIANEHYTTGLAHTRSGIERIDSYSRRKRIRVQRLDDMRASLETKETQIISILK